MFTVDFRPRVRVVVLVKRFRLCSPVSQARVPSDKTQSSPLIYRSSYDRCGTGSARRSKECHVLSVGSAVHKDYFEGICCNRPGRGNQVCWLRSKWLKPLGGGGGGCFHYFIVLFFFIKDSFQHICVASITEYEAAPSNPLIKRKGDKKKVNLKFTYRCY